MIWSLVLISVLTGNPVVDLKPLGKFSVYGHCDRMMQKMNAKRDISVSYFDCRLQLPNGIRENKEKIEAR